MTIHLVQLESVSDVRACARQWDQLWSRSEVTIPTLRAECLAKWLECFGTDRRFIAMVVEEDGQFVAAMPLLEKRLRRVVPVGGLPSNEWCHAGDFLFDETHSNDDAVRLLLDHIPSLPWPMIRIDAAAVESRRWETMRSAALRRGLRIDVRHRFHVGMIQMCSSWEEFQQRLSRNHCRKIRRRLRQLDQRGGLDFEIHSQFTPDEAERLARIAFEVEDRGWKGDRGSSVVKTPGMLEFYVAQVRHLARFGCPRFFFLCFNGRKIAFEYGWVSKRIYHSYKIGFDSEFAQYGPGQLLLYRMLEHFHASGNVTAVNGMGPIDNAMDRWAPRHFPIGRMLIASPTIPNRLFFRAYKFARQRL